MMRHESTVSGLLLGTSSFLSRLCLRGAEDGEKRLGNALAALAEVWTGSRAEQRRCGRQRCPGALPFSAVLRRGASPGPAAALGDSGHGAAAAALSHQLPPGPGAALL